MRLLESFRLETHQIQEMLMILEMMCHKLEDGEEIDYLDLKRVITFLKVFVEECHNLKEEQCLLPVLKANGATSEEIHEAELIEENKMGRFYVWVLGKVVKQMQNGDPLSRKKMIQIARKYIDLECKHIRLESEYLYPLCEKYLTQEQRDRTQEKCWELEDRKFGKDQHDTFHEAVGKLINKMHDTYLGDHFRN